MSQKGWSRWLINPFFLWIVAAIALGAWETYRYWGYFLIRPALVSEIEEFSTIDAWGTVDSAQSEVDLTDPTNPKLIIESPDNKSWTEVVSDAQENCRSSSNIFFDYPCLSNEAVLKFNQDQLITVDTNQLSSGNLVDWHQVFVETGLVEIPQPDYRGFDSRDGLIAVGRDRQDQPLVFIGLRGGQVENDHYPYYEVILRQKADSPGNWEAIAQRTFAIESAGIEQMDPIVWLIETVKWCLLLSPLLAIVYLPKILKHFNSQN